MTIGEATFERFCAMHGIPCARIGAQKVPTPDYLVNLAGVEVVVEIKQLDEDAKFSSAHSSRTLGDHVRAKINEARHQVRSAALQQTPAILLIYNNLDPLQRFGTEQQDFVAAMYGEPTVSLSIATGAIVDSYEGLNKSFRPGKNASFSAVGHLKQSDAGPLVHLYENLYAEVPLDYPRLPTHLSYTRFEAESDGNA